MVVNLIVGLIKKTQIKMSQYFPPYRSFGESISIRVNLPNYATKSNLREAKGIDASIFPLKSNLASLKTEVYKLDIDKLLPVLVDVSKLSDAVKYDVVKKNSV